LREGRGPDRKGRSTNRQDSVAAISEAAGAGAWAAIAIAEAPSDSALLAAAAGLCEKG